MADRTRLEEGHQEIMKDPGFQGDVEGTGRHPGIKKCAEAFGKEGSYSKTTVSRYSKTKPTSRPQLRV